jgi:hypothetical protein
VRPPGVELDGWAVVEYQVVVAGAGRALRAYRLSWLAVAAWGRVVGQQRTAFRYYSAA